MSFRFEIDCGFIVAAALAVNVDSEVDMVEARPTRAYTPEQVAERLSMGRTAVFEKLKSGELRSFVVGRSRRISDVALSEFITNLETKQRGDHE